MIQQNNDKRQSNKSAAGIMLTDSKGNNLVKTDEVQHPKNGIILVDGRVLECYPKETPQEDFTPDEVLLDTTGEYFAIGRRRLKPHKPEPDAEGRMAQQQLFTDNAFYLLAHRERILTDSRMFLAPVAIQSGLAYFGTGGFHDPTVGVYLEWWANCTGAMRTDEKGRRSLVYRLAGSPLSGCNRSNEVFEDGTTAVVTLSPFNAHWHPFININKRYTEAKQIYQAYSLQEVLDILHHEESGDTSYARSIKEMFMQHEIDSLNKRVKRLDKEYSALYNKYQDTLVKYNEARLRKACEEYKAFKVNADCEKDYLKEQKRDLKSELKSGRLDNIAYQRKLMPMNKRIKELDLKLSTMLFDMYNKFADDGISMTTIQNLINEN